MGEISRSRVAEPQQGSMLVRRKLELLQLQLAREPYDRSDDEIARRSLCRSFEGPIYQGFGGEVLRLRHSEDAVYLRPLLVGKAAFQSPLR